MYFKEGVMVRRLKRLAAITAILLLVMITCMLPSSAAWGASAHMINETGYLSDSETAALNDYFVRLSEELEFDIVGVMIADGYDEDSLTAAADDFYDYNGYGYGSEKDGAIFVVDMRSRMMVLVTTGFGINAITDAYEDDIYDYVSGSLSDGYYYDAFKKYADRVRYYVLKAREGGNGGGGGSNLPDAETAAGMGGISLAAGAGAGLFSSQRQKSKLKTVRRKTQANSYARRDSLVLTRKQDRFLYRTVAVVARPKNNNNHQGFGGGTTIHMGSSGTSHGGGHARGF